MREALWLLAGFACAWLGFALLALSQERHFARVYRSNGPVAYKQRPQRVIGFMAIGISLVCSIASQGASFGSLLWVLAIIAAALAVALLLTWRPQWLRWMPAQGQPSRDSSSPHLLP